MMLALLLAGHFGGEMTHGQNYLIENLPFVKKEISSLKITEAKKTETDSLFVYEDLVYPVLEEKCVACHNQKQSYGGLNMSSFEALLKGGNSGDGIQKGNPYKSLIYKRVSFPQDHPKFMPPAGLPLSYDQIATLEWWIDNGAEKQIPVTSVRKDPKIQRLMELQYGLDLREKTYLETLTLTPPSPNDLEAINGEKYAWRFINPEESFLDVKFTAKKIETKLKFKKIANCKVIAQRIQSFEIDKLLPKIKQNLRKMEDFFYDSYKGFYCSICNYENHKFIEI